MSSQVQKFYDLDVVDTSFIGVYSTPISANTNPNTPKPFAKDKFDPKNRLKNNPDCKFGIHHSSNHHNEKKYDTVQNLFTFADISLLAVDTTVVFTQRPSLKLSLKSPCVLFIPLFRLPIGRFFRFTILWSKIFKPLFHSYHSVQIICNKLRLYNIYDLFIYFNIVSIDLFLSGFPF